MTDTVGSFSPADNWYVSECLQSITSNWLAQAQNPIVQITSAIWLGTPEKFDQCTLQLHFIDDSSLGINDEQCSAVVSDENKVPNLCKEIIATFAASEASETQLDFILEGQQSYIFELIGKGEQCDIILFGRYLKSIHTDDNVHDSIDGSVSNLVEKSHELLELQVQDDILGVAGDAVQIGSKVTVWYSAKIVESDYVYEDVNVSNGEPAMFVVGSGDVIQGWEEGIIGMRAGGLRTMTISPNKAYGTEGKGTLVPPNATIQIKCSLVGVF